MGIVRLGPPEPLVLLLRDALAATSFIETGTFRGATAEWAGRHFQAVHSIELAESLFREASARLAGQENVNVYLGDTRSALPPLITGLDEPAVVWLDAHWSGGKTSGEGDQCPLLDELAITDQTDQPLAVLVDDARLFLSAPPEPLDLDDWPDISSLIRKLAQDGQRYVAIVEDVIVAVPAEYRDVVVAYCRKLATDALPKKSAWRRSIRNFGRRLRGKPAR